MTIQRLLSKLSSRWHRDRWHRGDGGVRKQTEKARRRRLLVEHLEDRKLLAAIHPLPLSSLNGANGFRLDGVAVNDFSGYSVSSAGDVNGDGFDDLIVGAPNTDHNGNSSGSSYVVFGKSGGFASAINLSTLGGTDGFRLDGVALNDGSGRNVSSAGDVNGDGFDDLIVGAQGADPNGVGSGSSYVVFGKSSGFASVINLSSLGGTNGLRLDGVAADDLSGLSVSSAGDVNGDGFHDLIVGAPYADPNGGYSGSSYVVFGKSSGFASAINLSTLSGTNGFRLDGVAVFDRSGWSLSSAGDVNGDGFDDLIVGAHGADPNGLGSGSSYVLFGQSSGFTSAINLSALGGTNGFRLDGVAADDLSGLSVSSAGDINGDGFDDLIVGAYRADPNGNNRAGSSYVVFGKSDGFADTINLSMLNGTNGFRMDGVSANEYSGYSVSSAGDVNGDGFDDLIVGAHGADPNGVGAGSSYVLFGKSGGFAAMINLSTLDGTTGFRMDGVAVFDRSGWSLSSAGDVNGDGFDDLIVGAWSADPNGSESGSSYVVFGGNFTGGAETQVGGSGNSTLSANQGTGAIDILIGGRGNDTLTSDGGSDVLIGGQGDDILVIPDVNFSGRRRLSGGNGVDTLRLNGLALTLDLTAIRDNRIEDIERIDLGSGRDHALKLTAREVRNLSSHSNTLTIDGSGSQVRFLDGVWSGPTLVDGNLYRQYTNGSATVKIRTTLTERVEVVPLDSLNGSNGFRINGLDTNDDDGLSVSSAGDVNGDGFDDLLIGAPYGDAAFYNTGKTYVVFGRSGGFTSAIELSSLDGTKGFRLDGVSGEDRSGWSVSTAGDVNGDGFDDLIIGARWADPVGSASGESYVVFGKSGVFASSLSLSSLDGTNGFRLYGIDVFDLSGWSVSSAGDINGDGFDDMFIGALYGGATDSGAGYVVFGTSRGFPPSLSLSALDGSNGFRLNGIDAGDRAGISVSGAGDVNGDGFHDLIIGASLADAEGTNSGESYVVFGKSSGFNSAIELSSLNGANGFRIDGIDANDQSGGSVSAAGDVNGDGFDDLIVGAWAADVGGPFSGESYVVFGKSGGFASSLSLSSLNGTNGFRLDGIDAEDISGLIVSKAGDVNGDGFDDLIIGAPLADPGGILQSGESYLVFGKSGGFTSSLALSSLDGSNGFRLDGFVEWDQTGSSVSYAGDLNGDGFDDLIIGGESSTTLIPHINKSYVVFGRNFTGGIETQVGSNANNTLFANQGGSAIDILIGGRGNDALFSDGGSDVLIGGHGNDTLVIPDVNFSGRRRLSGGSGFDTLVLEGGSQTLDLPNIRDNRIEDIEQIDITGSGNNTLFLTVREVLNISSHSNTLVVKRNDGDLVNIGTGWTREPDEIIGSDNFHVYTQGAAVLKLQEVTATILSRKVNHVGYTGSGASIDNIKQLAKEGAVAQTLGFSNLINTAHGINGIVFDIHSLHGSPTAGDFVFQMSPTGAFDAGANPAGSWTTAPAPTSVTSTTTDATSRVSIAWPNNAIANRWLRITVNASANTGLAAAEVFYVGHLLGETTGPSGSVFTVSFADITPIRSAVGNTVNASSIVDIDKNGTVAFADISAMQPSVGAQLTIITIPASGGGGGGGMASTLPGGGGLGGGVSNEGSGDGLLSVRGDWLDQQYQDGILQSAAVSATSPQASKAARDWLFGRIGANAVRRPNAESELGAPPADLNLELESILEQIIL